MTEDAALPEDDNSERRIVTDGFFEREVHLSREETAEFLRNLATQIEADTSVTISSDEWEIPFEYAAPIEVEVEFTHQRHRELEIEVEFTEPTETGGINVD